MGEVGVWGSRFAVLDGLGVWGSNSGAALATAALPAASTTALIVAPAMTRAFIFVRMSCFLSVRAEGCWWLCHDPAGLRRRGLCGFRCVAPSSSHSHRVYLMSGVYRVTRYLATVNGRRAIAARHQGIRVEGADGPAGEKGHQHPRGKPPRRRVIWECACAAARHGFIPGRRQGSRSTAVRRMEGTGCCCGGRPNSRRTGRFRRRGRSWSGRSSRGSMRSLLRPAR